jgi:hypothetical protein
VRTTKVRISNACTYSQTHGACSGYEDRALYGRRFRCVCACHKKTNKPKEGAR